MIKKTLPGLLLVTAVACIAAIILYQSNKQAVPEYDELVFPQLMQNINNVKRIEVSTATDHFFVINTDEHGWIIPKKDNYFVSTNIIREVLLGLAELKPLEKKTSDKNKFSKLDLDDISIASSKAVQLSLLDKDKKPIAKLLIGKEQASQHNNRLSEYFVRKPQSQQTWLTIGSLPVYKTPLEWFDQSILTIDEQRIKEIKLIRQNGNIIHLARKNSTDQDYTLQNLPKKKQLKSQFEVNYIAQTLAELSLADVLSSKDIDFTKAPGVRAQLSTFDGLSIDITSSNPDKRTHYIKLYASLSPAVTLKQEDKVQRETEVQQLNKRFSQFVFAIPDYEYDELNKKLSDLIKAEKA